MPSIRFLCIAIVLLLGVADVDGFVTPVHCRASNVAVHSSTSTFLNYEPDTSAYMEEKKRKRRKKSQLANRVRKQVTSISQSSGLGEVLDAKRRKIRRKSSQLVNRDLDSALSAEAANFSLKKTPKRGRDEDVVRATTSFAQTTYPRTLTREEEYDLTYKVQAMRAAEKKKEELTVKGSEPTETELAEACGMRSKSELRTVMEVGRAALDQFVYRNMGMVNVHAMKYAKHLEGMNVRGGVGTIVSYEDLIQEGTMGVIEAIERFDPKRGFRFYTYAQYWVKSHMMAFMSSHSRAIRLPMNVQNTMRKVRKARKKLLSERGLPPTYQELADYLGIDAEKIRLYTERSQFALSLDADIYTQSKGGGLNDKPMTLADKISTIDGGEQENMIEVVSRRRDVLEVVNGLPAEERDVVMARYGLDGAESSLAQTARKLGTTTDRVRMLEARALNKLRHPQRSSRLRDYVDVPKTALEKQQEKAAKAKKQSEKFFVETEEELMAQLSPDGIWAF